MSPSAAYLSPTSSTASSTATLASVPCEPTHSSPFAYKEPKESKSFIQSIRRHLSKVTSKKAVKRPSFSSSSMSTISSSSSLSSSASSTSSTSPGCSSSISLPATCQNYDQLLQSRRHSVTALPPTPHPADRRPSIASQTNSILMYPNPPILRQSASLSSSASTTTTPSSPSKSLDESPKRRLSLSSRLAWIFKKRKWSQDDPMYLHPRAIAN